MFAAFDDPDLIALAGLIPAVLLAERCDLPRLVAEKVKLTGARNGAGTAEDAKTLSIVAGMVAGAFGARDDCTTSILKRILDHLAIEIKKEAAREGARRGTARAR
ncbi:hypothetical protein ABTZ59_32400 [Streptomyces sp. NPDC094034]|uniref:hypothetical protein n=1 Tax=Streptomyces sp. NPDC094034 TaxID=3155309 RepID=UPI003329B15A